MKIKINSTGQIFTATAEQELEPNQEVLVEIENVVEPAKVICQKSCPKQEVTENCRFIRVLKEEDENTRSDLKKQANEFLNKAQEKVFRHGIEMKILDADLSWDQKKIIFYFSAPGRVDFRSLVADMAGDFRKIIRLQQVGARDEARLFGGFGKCGRELCCSKFLSDIEGVSGDVTEATENQGIKPSMLTGCCGKLMCCLAYEDNQSKDTKLSHKQKAVGSEKE